MVNPYQNSPTQVVNNPKAQPKGTGFVNLNQYLQANKGVNLGNTLANGIQSDVNKVNQGLQKSQSQFTQGVNDVNAKTGDYQNKANQTFQNLDTNYNNLNTQAQQTPAAYDATQYKDHNLLTPQDYSTFGDIRGYQYNGPTQLNDINNIQKQALNTESLGNLTNSNEGRAALLGRYVNNPQYNSFQQGLDSVYLQGAQPQLQQARQATRNLYDKTTNAANSATGQANLATKGINDLKSGVNDTIQTTQDTRLAALNNLANQYKTQQSDLSNNLTNAFQTGNFNDQLKDLTGLTSGSKFWNANPDQFTTKEAEANQSNVGNVADRAQLYALSQLAGNQQASVDLGGAQYDPNKALQFDKGAFNQFTDSTSKAYENELNNTKNPNYIPYDPSHPEWHPTNGGEFLGDALKNDAGGVQSLYNTYNSQSPELFKNFTPEEINSIQTGNFNTDLINKLKGVGNGFGSLNQGLFNELSGLTPLLQNLNSKYGFNNTVK